MEVEAVKVVGWSRGCSCCRMGVEAVGALGWEKRL